MISLVVRFFETLLTIATVIALGVSVLAGTQFGHNWGLGALGSILGGVIGAVAGLFLVALVLGIPILLLRINQNLEKIHIVLARPLALGQAPQPVSEKAPSSVG